MEFDKSIVERIIREVVAEYAAGMPSGAPPTRKVDPSGVMMIDPASVKTEPFPFPIESPPGSVRLVDLMTLGESPRLGAGIMEMDSTTFEWTLEYDEVDYIIDGTLELVMDGRPVAASTGQVLFIPKGTKLCFSAPGKVRFLYVVYPANWAEQ